MLFSVYDQKAAAFLDPFVAPTIDFAIREFRTAVNSPKHQFARYPEDYVLFKLGEFDPDTGLVLPEAAPVNISIGLTLVEGVEEPVGAFDA